LFVASVLPRPQRKQCPFHGSESKYKSELRKTSVAPELAPERLKAPAKLNQFFVR
jgi:hypothetical protein